jgi:hypothetical protein
MCPIAPKISVTSDKRLRLTEFSKTKGQLPNIQIETIRFIRNSILVKKPHFIQLTTGSTESSGAKSPSDSSRLEMDY